MVNKKPKFKVGDKVIIVGPNSFGNYEPKHGIRKGAIVEVVENRPEKNWDMIIKNLKEQWVFYWPGENLVPATRAHRILYT